MNFYSDDITKGIQSAQELDEFYKTVFILSCKYSNTIVSPKYILSLVSDKSNSIAFRCIDTEFNVHNCPSILIYYKHFDSVKNEDMYYILMICTKRSFKNMGYASGLLDDFIGHIRNTRENANTCRIALSSIETAVTFYEQYGFKWMRTSLTDHPKLMDFERYDAEKEYFILELVVSREPMPAHSA